MCIHKFRKVLLFLAFHFFIGSRHRRAVLVDLLEVFCHMYRSEEHRFFLSPRPRSTSGVSGYYFEIAHSNFLFHPAPARPMQDEAASQEPGRCGACRRCCALLGMAASVRIQRYQDWGEYAAWRRHTRQFCTYLRGCTQGSPISSGHVRPIGPNIDGG